MTADMGAATYPQVSFSYNGFNLNTLTGYAKEMDIPAMRDTATPVTDQKVDVGIQAYENKVSSVNYIVYTLDGKEELKKEKVKKPGEEFSIDLSAEGLMKEERVLEIVLHMPDEKSVYFYTRLVDATNANMLLSLIHILPGRTVLMRLNWKSPEQDSLSGSPDLDGKQVMRPVTRQEV